jgi:GxxExxY protein
MMKDSQESRKTGKALELSAITDRVIGCAISVHRELGPGFIESIYEQALALEFSAQGIAFAQQKVVPVSYRGTYIGEHRLDFHVEDRLVVELKAVKALEDVHFAIVRSYLKATHLDHGLILNFSTMPLTIKRVLRERPAGKADVIHANFS